MIVSIHQPAYLPWLGYFARIAESDVHITLDHVEFGKNSFINRNKILSKGRELWLTVPVKTKGRFGDMPINSIEIDNSTNWRKKHWASIKENYSKARYFRNHAGYFEDIYSREWNLLVDLCESINVYLREVMRIHTPIKLSSEMLPQGCKDELLVDLCEKESACTYLSGVLGKKYIRERVFERASIKVLYQDFKIPIYPQIGCTEFVPRLSAIDLLFNQPELVGSVLEP